MSYRRLDLVLCTKARLESIWRSWLRHCWVAELALLEVLERIDRREGASEPPYVLQLTLCWRRWIESIAHASLTQQGLHVHYGWVLIEIWLLSLELLIKPCCESRLLPRTNHGWTTTKWTRLKRKACRCWEPISHAEPSLCLLQYLS